MSSQNSVHLVLVTIELVLAESASLKAKRSVVNRIKDRVKSRFNAAIAEVGELDKWQRAVLAVTMVSNENRKLKADVDKLEDSIRSFTEVSVNEFSVEWL